jgi:hypothetical protein
LILHCLRCTRTTKAITAASNAVAVVKIKSSISSLPCECGGHVFNADAFVGDCFGSVLGITLADLACLDPCGAKLLAEYSPDQSA